MRVGDGSVSGSVWIKYYGMSLNAPESRARTNQQPALESWTPSRRRRAPALDIHHHPGPFCTRTKVRSIDGAQNSPYIFPGRHFLAHPHWPAAAMSEYTIVRWNAIPLDRPPDDVAAPASSSLKVLAPSLC